jgi:hypothetical protein
MMEGSPDSDRGVLAQLGDFLHWDGLEAVTPQNKHLLDADTRYTKLARLALDVTENAVEMLLEKHKEVDVFLLEGNHDIVSSVWLREAISRIFRDNKRCRVHTSPKPYYALLFGDVFLGYHHGHLTKLKDLTEYFSSAEDFRPMWGAAKYTYLHCGHLHHHEKKEAGGAIVEQHPTLAANDAFAARNGYVNQRRTQAITYHKNDGEIARSGVTPRRR